MRASRVQRATLKSRLAHSCSFPFVFMPFVSIRSLLWNSLIIDGAVAVSNTRLWRSQPRHSTSEGSRRFSIFSPVQSLQYLLFLPAIFRGLLQELRRPVRRASFAPLPQLSGLRSNRDCLFQFVLLPVLSWDRARNHPPFGSFGSSTPYPIIRRVDRLQVMNRLPRACISSKAVFTAILLKMLFAGSMMSLTM